MCRRAAFAAVSLAPASRSSCTTRSMSRRAASSIARDSSRARRSIVRSASRAAFSRAPTFANRAAALSCAIAASRSRSSSSAERRSRSASSALRSRSSPDMRCSARASTSSGSASRRAMPSPYERPGTPLSSRYVGSRRCSSNCSDALTMPGCSVASSLSAPRCVVATVRVPRAVSASSTAAPSAAPSDGSVPEPSSSTSASESPVARARISPRFRRMRAERRETGLDRLLVADVGEAIIEERDAALVAHGGGDPRLGHRGEQAERLEQHRLAAGVRAGEEQRALARVHREVERDHGAGTRGEQRMAAGEDREAFARRRERRRHARELIREASARVQRVEHDERLERFGEAIAQRTHLVGERREDALDLVALLRLDLADAVTEFHGGRRLHEQRAAAPRLVVHDAAHGVPPFAAHRDHVATVAHRHRHVGHARVVVEAREDLLEHLHELGLRGGALAAELAQRRGCGIEHREVVADRSRDRCFLALRDSQCRRERGEPARRARRRQRIAREARRPQHDREPDQLRGAEHAPGGAQARERGPDLRDRFWTPPVRTRDRRARGRHQLMLALDPRAVSGRRERPHARRAKRRCRAARDQVEHLREFQHLQRMPVHDTTPTKGWRPDGSNFARVRAPWWFASMITVRAEGPAPRARCG